MRIRFALFGDDPAYAPTLAHRDDACYDLVARSFALPGALDGESEALTLPPRGRCLVRTGVFLEMEPGWEALVRPRSGNALNRGLTVLNAPGTIDAGYRNEVGVIVYNAGSGPVELAKGMRIAQVAFRAIPGHELQPISRAEFNAGTARSLKGFGSSGA